MACKMSIVCPSSWFVSFQLMSSIFPVAGSELPFFEMDWTPGTTVRKKKNGAKKGPIR